MNKNPTSPIVGLKAISVGLLFKKKKKPPKKNPHPEWLSTRRLLKGAGQTELVRKQLSSVSAGIWPCETLKKPFKVYIKKQLFYH